MEKKTAEKIALKVLGVKGVAEDIVINLAFNHQKTDSELAQAVVDALKWNVLVPHEKVKVRVENGWVTTEGMVEWAYEKKAVEKAISGITGLKGLSNLVKITPKVNPEDVRKKITAAFQRSASIDANTIQIDHFGNRVVLSGKVRSYSERREAERAAWNVPGVSEVENNIEVKIPSFAELGREL